MNIVGLDPKDISDGGFGWTDNDFKYVKAQTYDVLFGFKTYNIDPTTKKVMDINLANSVQVFYALENNRYLGKKGDTFKKSPDKCMTDILNYMYSDFYDKVNAKAKRHLSKCVPDSKMSHIPFA